MPKPDPYYSFKRYSEDFLEVGSALNEKTLERALDIRKFEIDLYWKRATYFWTFIAATLGGFILVQTSAPSNKEAMSVLLANLGIVFSFGWFCVNRGSKFWQENWEFHVDILEDAINGPLYKVVISRPDPMGLERLPHFLTGPTKISVSKINQMISVFVTVMWLCLLYYALPPFRWGGPINPEYAVLIAITTLTCGPGFLWLGKRSTGDHFREATIRSRKIKNPTPPGDT